MNSASSGADLKSKQRAKTSATSSADKAAKSKWSLKKALTPPGSINCLNHWFGGKLRNQARSIARTTQLTMGPASHDIRFIQYCGAGCQRTFWLPDQEKIFLLTFPFIEQVTLFLLCGFAVFNDAH